MIDLLTTYSLRRLLLLVAVVSLAIIGVSQLLAQSAQAHPASPVVLRADGDGLVPDGSQPALSGGIWDPATVLAYGGATPTPTGDYGNAGAIRPKVMDLNSCWTTCKMVFTQYDHNFTECRGSGGVAYAEDPLDPDFAADPYCIPPSYPDPMGCYPFWCDQGRMVACRSYNCSSNQTCDIFLDPSRGLSGVPCVGYGQCAGPKENQSDCESTWAFNCNDMGLFKDVVFTDCDNPSGGTNFIKGSPYWDVITDLAPVAPQSHKSIFIGTQAQDRYNHAGAYCNASAYASYGLIEWGVDYSASYQPPGDCSPFGVGNIRYNWFRYPNLGGCGAVLVVPQHGSCVGNVSAETDLGGPFRAAQGPWYTDWRPDPPRLSSRFRYTTSGGAYQTVDRGPRLTAQYSDPDNRVVSGVGPVESPANGAGRMQFSVSPSWLALFTGFSYSSPIYSVPHNGTRNWDVPPLPLPSAGGSQQYFWNARTWDHHGLWNDGPIQSFVLSNPNVRPCDTRYYIYECGVPADPIAPVIAPPTDTVGGPKSATVGAGSTTPPDTPVFTYTLLENSASATTQLNAASCNETAPVEEVTGARKLNEIVSVHIDLSKFVSQSSGTNNNFGQAEGSLSATLDLRNRQSSDYLYALGCKQ